MVRDFPLLRVVMRGALQYSALLKPPCLNCSAGESLLSLGKAHTQLASLQSTFARDTSNIFLTRIARSKAAMDAYALARRKLEQRTAAYESAKAKQQKSKREKRELEEELRLAKAS